MLERNEKKMNGRAGEPYWVTRVQKGAMSREKLNKLYRFKKKKKKKKKKKFPNTCQALRYSAVGMFVTNPTFLV